jgi:hypothetical protein
MNVILVPNKSITSSRHAQPAGLRFTIKGRQQ